MSDLQEMPKAGMKDVDDEIRKLRSILPMEAVLKSIGELDAQLFIATNAVAGEPDHLVKVQGCLFNVLKICDNWNRVLNSLKSGGGNILEKLHMAFSYLLEGLTEYASPDVEAASSDVEAMNRITLEFMQCLKTSDAAMKEALASLEKDEVKNCTELRSGLQDYKPKIDHFLGLMVEHLCTTSMGTIEGDRYKSFQSKRDSLKSLFDSIELKRLAILMMKRAMPVMEGLKSNSSKFEKWTKDCYIECKKQLETTIKDNVGRTKGMSEEKVVEFWSKLPHMKDVYRYLCRWKALQTVSGESQQAAKRVRASAEEHYTTNLYRPDAIARARKLAEDDDQKIILELYRMRTLEEKTDTFWLKRTDPSILITGGATYSLDNFNDFKADRADAKSINELDKFEQELTKDQLGLPLELLRSSLVVCKVDEFGHRDKTLENFCQTWNQKMQDIKELSSKIFSALFTRNTFLLDGFPELVRNDSLDIDVIYKKCKEKVAIKTGNTDIDLPGLTEYFKTSRENAFEEKLRGHIRLQISIAHSSPASKPPPQLSHQPQLSSQEIQSIEDGLKLLKMAEYAAANGELPGKLMSSQQQFDRKMANILEAWINDYKTIREGASRDMTSWKRKNFQYTCRWLLLVEACKKHVFGAPMQKDEVLRQIEIDASLSPTYKRVEREFSAWKHEEREKITQALSKQASNKKGREEKKAGEETKNQDGKSTKPGFFSRW